MIERVRDYRPRTSTLLVMHYCNKQTDIDRFVHNDEQFDGNRILTPKVVPEAVLFSFNRPY